MRKQAQTHRQPPIPAAAAQRRPLPALILLAMAGACAAPGTLIAADLHVPSQYATIRAAITAAQNDDTIIVADGNYAGVGFSNLQFGGKKLTIRSANGPGACTLDALRNGSVFRLAATDPAGSVIEGFTIRGATQSGIQIVGTAATIRECMITDNWNGGLGGGGIFVDAGGTAVITDCILELGLASQGGGILVWQGSQGILTRCTISGNRVDITGGGGAMADLGSVLIMDSCIVRDNQSIGFFGGSAGVRIARDSIGRIRNSLIHGNTASSNGGGISFTNTSSGEVINCTVAHNQASGPGGGLLLTTGVGDVYVLNSIFWGNSPGEFDPGGGNLVVAYSLIGGGWAGTGNLNTDPLFADPFAGDFRPGAPETIDSGSNIAVPPSILTDLDGNPRYVDILGLANTGIPGGLGGTNIVDLGAYETQNTFCYANCDGSQLPPFLNVDDFTCYINEFAAAAQQPHAQQVTSYANCDGSTTAPALNVDDFTCFINAFAAGCR